MPRGGIGILITADGRQAIRSFEQVGLAARRSAASVATGNKESAASMDAMAVSTKRARSAVGGMLGMVGLGGLAFGLKDAVQAGIALQDQQTQLAAAVKATGLAAGSTTQLLDAATKSSEHGGFSRDQEINSMTRFVRTTGSVNAALRANKTAVLLARGGHLDYAQSQKYVQQALVGNVRRLQQYVGIIQPVKTAEYALSQAHRANVIQLQAQAKAMGTAGPAWLKQQELIRGITPAMMQHAQLLDKQATGTELLARVQERFSGALDTYNRSTAGRLSNLKNSFSELIATLGESLLPAVNRVVAVLGGLFGWLNRNRVVLYALMGTVTGVVGVLTIYTAVTKTAEAATIAWNFVSRIAKGTASGLSAAVKFLSGMFTTSATTTELANGQMTLFGDTAEVTTGKTATMGTTSEVAAGRMAMVGDSAVAATGELGTLDGALTATQGELVATGTVAEAESITIGAAFARIGSAAIAVLGPIAALYGGLELLKKFGTPDKKAHTINRHIQGVKGTQHYYNPRVAPGTRDHPIAYNKLPPLPGQQHHALGGMIHGTGSLDNVLFWGTPGEGILSRMAMRLIGGERTLNALNRGHMPGGARGEGVLSRTAMHLTRGERALAALNRERASKAGHVAPQAITITPGVVVVKLQERAIAQAVYRFTVEKAARGPSSLSGGSLATGLAGAIDLTGSQG